MASIGALLDHLIRERAINDLEDDDIGGLDVRDIEILSMCASLRCRNEFG
jgi:DNA mismatch repair protein MSH5